MMKKNTLIILLKLTVGFGALTLLIYRVDFYRIWNLVKYSNGLLLGMALFLFIISKLFSAYRLKHFFSNIQLEISQSYNLKLYLLGMYYNTILPGGIGGDGYKVWVLLKRLKDQNLNRSQLIKAILYDRINGLLVLTCLLALLLFFYIHQLALIPVFIVGLIAIASIHKLFFSAFDLFLPTLYSLGVQLSQLLSAICIIYALGITQNISSMLIVFMVSSIASALPISIGGIGIRELVFYYLSGYLQISTEKGVSIALVFFLISFLVSMSGFYFSIVSPEKIPYQSIKNLNPQTGI